MAVQVRGAELAEQEVERGLARAVHDPGTCSIAHMSDKLAPITWTIPLGWVGARRGSGVSSRPWPINVGHSAQPRSLGS